MLSSSLNRFFWDVNPAQLNLDQHASFIIERILEYGDIPAFTWLREKYTQEQLIKILKTTRSLSKRSANFWSLYYHLNPAEVPCIQKSWPQKLQAVLKN